MATAAKSELVVPSQERMCERHYSPAELAAQWHLSPDSIRRIFEREPGVLVFENPVRSSSRHFRTMRIPESVAARVYRRLSTHRLDWRG